MSLPKKNRKSKVAQKPASSTPRRDSAPRSPLWAQASYDTDKIAADLEYDEPFLPTEPRLAQLAGKVGRHHALLMLLCAICLWLILAVPSLRPQSEYQKGDAAVADIVAPHAALIADRVETDARRREAASLVPPVYDGNPSAQDRALARLSTLMQARQNQFTRAQRARIANASESAIRLVYRGGQIRSDVEDDKNAARLRITVALQKSNLLNPLSPLEYSAARQMAQSAARFPNLIVDERATQRAREDAQSEVKAVFQRVESGDILVKSGETLNDEKWSMLQELGLIAARFDFQTAFAQLMLCVLMVLLASGYVVALDRPLLSRPSALWLAAITPVVFLLVFRLLLRVPHADLLLVPLAAAAAILLTILLEARLGIMVGFMIAALGATLAKGDSGLFLTATLASWIGALSTSNIASRPQLARAAMLVGATSAVLVSVFGILHETAMQQVFSLSLWSGVAGTIAVGAAVALAMLLERPFAITTHLRLMELLAPDEAILRRLQTEAPGTYTHSLMVSLLGEAAAKVVDADPLICRVGGLYHDIGKLRRPHCFVENQAGENIHDRLSPQVSAKLIVAHVADGLALGRALKLPRPILDIIATHHGTTRVEYFYRQALSQNEILESSMHDSRLTPDFDESDFRYPGPRAGSKEQGIIALADAVEASARALTAPTPEKLEHHVQAMIGNRLRDGELADCELTLRDLGKIGDAFLHVLRGALHHRIEYPSAEKISDKNTSETKFGDTEDDSERGELENGFDEDSLKHNAQQQHDAVWMQDALAERFFKNELAPQMTTQSTIQSTAQSTPASPETAAQKTSPR